GGSADQQGGGEQSGADAEGDEPGPDPLVLAGGDPAGLGERPGQAVGGPALGVGQRALQVALADGLLDVAEVRQGPARRPGAGAVAGEYGEQQREQREREGEGPGPPQHGARPGQRG